MQSLATVDNSSSGKRNKITPLKSGKNNTKNNKKGKSKSRRRKEKQVSSIFNGPRILMLDNNMTSDYF